MYQIRKAILEDCLGIAKTQVDSYRTAYAGLFPLAYLEHFTYTEEEQDWIQRRLLIQKIYFWLPYRRKKRLLDIFSPEQNQIFSPAMISEIVAFHVQQSLQGKGIGKALLSHAIKNLIARDCKSVMLWTLKYNKVRQWYEKLNGKILGEINYEVDDWVISEVAYGWEEISKLDTLGRKLN